MTEPETDLPVADVTLTDLAVPSPEDLAAAHPCPMTVLGTDPVPPHDPHRVSGEDGALVWSWECDGNGAPAVSAARELTWDDLPPRPWDEAAVPPPDVLADYLLSLEYEQLVWLLGRQSQVWAQDSRCFVLNHEAELDRLRSQPPEVRVVTPTALEAGKVYVIATDVSGELGVATATAVHQLGEAAGCRFLILGPGARLLDPGAISAAAAHSFPPVGT